MTYTPKFGDKPFTSRCKSCVFFARESESWEMDHCYWFVCRKRPANESLKTFPFKNGCKYHMTTEPQP